jgi:hypothetical protein
MFPCEISAMAKNSKVRVFEMIEGMIEGSKVLRVDFVSEDPPRVLGAAAVLIRKEMSPYEFTDVLREMADHIDKFLWRDK